MILTKLLYAYIGITNGGIFLGNNLEPMLGSQRLRFSAVALMNCGIWHANYKPDKFSAVLFVDTSRNSELCEYNRGTVVKLRDKGLAAEQLVSEPLPVTPLFFYEGLDGGSLLGVGGRAYQTAPVANPVMSAAESRRLHSGLMAAGFLWPATYVLLKDPTLERHMQEIKLVRLSCISLRCGTHFDN